MAEEVKVEATRPARKVRPGEYGILKMKPEEIRNEEGAIKMYVTELMEKGDPFPDEARNEGCTAIADLLEDWGLEELAGTLRWCAVY